MSTRPEPTTWRILPTNRGHFMWEVSSEEAWFRSEEFPKAHVLEEDEMPSSRLSSMTDLLIQAERSDLLSNKSRFLDHHSAGPKTGAVKGGNDFGSAMFSTGSGKALSARQSSIKKAKYLLEGENVADEASCGSTECFPMFRTGLGKAVQVSLSSINKAAALLEGTNDKQDLLMDQIDNTLPKHKKIEKETLMDSSFRIGNTIDGDNIATFQSYPNSGLMNFGLPGNPVCSAAVEDHTVHEVHDNPSTFHPLKFNTAGGRSISISTGALKRARALLNDSGSEALDSDVKANEQIYSTHENNKIIFKASSNIKCVSFDSLHEENFLNRNILDVPSSVTHLSYSHMEPLTSTTLAKEIDSNRYHLSNNNGCSRIANENLSVVHRNVSCSRMVTKSRPAVGPLDDISNFTGSSFGNKSWLNSEKKLPGKGNCSSFKKPRTSRFTTPLNCTSSSLAETEAALPSTSADFCYRKRVSTRYPFLLQRKKLKEYFGGPPVQYKNVSGSASSITADNSAKYRFHDTCSSKDFGPDEFREMLLQSGAFPRDATEKWVENHYKWIVWKLACLERCYPSESIYKFLTVSNVLEELKYRYEREVNHGHRSALKIILDGDISPSSMMILCISAIYSCSGPGMDAVVRSSEFQEDGVKLFGFDSNYVVKVELTDGWYSMNATLDVHLSKLVFTGKLFVGQKLRVCGATLSGWVEPVSPLEASMVSFILHINGTFRAQWADPLGLCKGLGTPLAFRCIKGGGGRVHMTLVGISRLYPILYKERLPDGVSVVRSESEEIKILQLNSQRRSEIAEAIILEFEDAPVNVHDSGEGAKIHRILEGSAEPEVLMAGMSSEQLISFSRYQEKQEELRQAILHKKIEKAFLEAGLGSRDVTPFMRVRVTGLVCVGSSRKGQSQEGLINIWNPTEKQKLDLKEGQMYSVSSLVPLSGSSDSLCLHTRGASSDWIHLPSTKSKQFKPFFIPRKSVSLSTLGGVPLASEFDISAVVVHVGKVYVSGCQRKQWIFVTDGSGGIRNSLAEDQPDGLLAISFCSPIFDSDSVAPISHHLSGSIACFCNLIKRARDGNKNLWVAEATENSTFCVFHNISCGSHLKEAADSALKWATTSSSALQKLRMRVLSIIGDDGF